MRDSDSDNLPIVTSLFTKNPHTKIVANPHSPSPWDDKPTPSPIIASSFLILGREPMSWLRTWISATVVSVSAGLGYFYGMNIVSSFFNIKDYISSPTVHFALVEESYVKGPVAIATGGIVYRLIEEAHRLLQLILRWRAIRAIEKQKAPGENSPILLEYVCPSIPVESRYAINRYRLITAFKRVGGLCLDIAAILLLTMAPGYIRSWLSLTFMLDPHQQNQMTWYIEPQVLLLTAAATGRIVRNAQIASYNSWQTVSAPNKVVVLTEEDTKKEESKTAMCCC